MAPNIIGIKEKLKTTTGVLIEKNLERTISVANSNEDKTIFLILDIKNFLS